MALQLPEGLLMYACVLADILERYAQHSTSKSKSKNTTHLNKQLHLLTHLTPTNHLTTYPPQPTTTASCPRCGRWWCSAT